MDHYRINQVPIGTPISFESHPGATYASFSPLGRQDAYFAPLGHPGTKYVIPWGTAPENPATRYDLRPEQKAYAQKEYLAFLQRQNQQGAYVRPAPVVWDPGPRAWDTVPEPSPAPQRQGPCTCSKCLSTCNCRACQQRRATEKAEKAATRKAEKAAAGSFFWLGVLGLIGAALWCLPCWAMVAHNQSPSPFVGFFGGLWFLSTFLVAPAGVLYFLGGVYSLF